MAGIFLTFQFIKMTKLSADNVHDIILKCLFKPDEKTDGSVIVEGVRLKIGFDPVRLEAQRVAITEMLSQLPDVFMQNIGSGWSFLNACNNNNGEQWADAHATIDELLCLGLAINKIAYNMPRALWQSLPGGMPYFYVKN